MPAHSPFTVLCQTMARGRLGTGRSDLHVHTTCSDGTYTPAEVVELARRSGLAGLAVTDHDTMGGIAAAREAARGSALEIIPGVEITAEYRGRELHLLGYFVRPEDEPLRAALKRVQQHRVGRFWDMVDRLRKCGLSLRAEDLPGEGSDVVLGRRHLALLLVQTRQAGSVREAFSRYLGDGGRAAVPKVRLPLEAAIGLVGDAGGVAGWAHPSYDCNRERLAELRGLGLGAVEVDYPGFRPGRSRELRALAGALGLAVTGGSDCHGPGHFHRDVGACGVTAAELACLRQRASVRGM